MITDQQKNAYLSKIGITDTIKVCKTDLKRLVEGHCFTFPYETFNVHDSTFDHDPKKRSSLAFSTLFKKLLKENRGGRCVELNIFLQKMLQSFGFEVMPILPETLWHHEDKKKGERPKHSAALVTCEGQTFLVDAAFGGLGILSPLPLKPGTYPQYSETFKLVAKTDYAYELYSKQEDQWKAIYGFDCKEASLAHYANIDAQNSEPLREKCYFKNYFICTKPFKIDNNKNGRVRLVNEEFMIYENGKMTLKQNITSQQQFHALAKDYFNIDLRG
ncbi:MAG TPA: arylamine N-acetyltransferase, partial [Gammaproteobacteria bacterium]|nr:arylamine N-acetyltransferase [Gammaproteobacteria bacterium]